MTFIFTPASHILVVNVCLSEWQLKWGSNTSGSSLCKNCSSLQSRIILRIALFKVAWYCACPKRLIKIKSEYLPATQQTQTSEPVSLWNNYAHCHTLHESVLHSALHTSYSRCDASCAIVNLQRPCSFSARRNLSSTRDFMYRVA